MVNKREREIEKYDKREKLSVLRMKKMNYFKNETNVSGNHE